MKSPYTGGQVKEVTTSETITFKGEEFTIDVVNYECVDTGNKFATGEMNDEVAARVQALWRKKHKVPTTEQLKAVREQLGLSMRKMAAFLNFGVNQYRYYEAGEIPKGANLLLLRMLVNPGALPHILATQADMLPAKTKAALKKYINGTASIIKVENTPKVNEREPNHIFDLHGDSFKDLNYETPNNLNILELSCPV